MSNKANAKVLFKQTKGIQLKEISSLKKIMNEYKVERKANWKLFKNKMNEDIAKIQKAMAELSARNKKS